MSPEKFIADRTRMLEHRIKCLNGDLALANAELAVLALAAVGQAPATQGLREYFREPIKILPHEEGEEFVIRRDVEGRLVRIRNPHHRKSSPGADTPADQSGPASHCPEEYTGPPQTPHSEASTPEQSPSPAQGDRPDAPEHPELPTVAWRHEDEHTAAGAGQEYSSGDDLEFINEESSTKGGPL